MDYGIASLIASFAAPFVAVWLLKKVYPEIGSKADRSRIDHAKGFGFWVTTESAFYAFQQCPDTPERSAEEIWHDRIGISQHFEAGARAAAERFGIDLGDE